MDNLSIPTAGINPAGIHAYIDTVELFFRFLDRKQWHSLVRLVREGSKSALRECRTQDGHLYGYRLIVNGPDLNLPKLKQLDRMQRQYRGKLTRFDLALDIQTDSPAALRELIMRQAVLKWRREAPMQEVGDTVYWQEAKRSNRNLVLYSDKANKITGELDCVHLELRFLRIDGVKRQGVHRIEQLIRINPNELFKKHVKWATTEHQIVTLMRKAVKEDIERNKGKELNPFMDKYRATIKRRVRGLLKRSGQDKAQVVKEAQSIPCPLNIPTHLSFQQLEERNACIEDKGEF